MRRVLPLMLAVCIGVAGCAEPVGGDPRPDPAAPRSTSSTPTADPDSREARWMNSLCGAGKLMVTAAANQPQPRTSSDPAVLKRDFIELTGRLAGVLDTAVTDFTRLLPAPVAGMDDVVGTIVEHMTSARDSLNHARSTVEATEPITAEVYGAAVDEAARGLSSLQKAVDFIEVVKFPDVLIEAGAVAPNCADSGFPVGTR